MVSQLIQLILLLVIVFIIGAILGRLLKQVRQGRATNPSSRRSSGDSNSRQSSNADPSVSATSEQEQVSSGSADYRSAAAAAGSSPPQFHAGLPKGHPLPSENLKLIKGVGPKSEDQLNALGVNRYQQIAEWSAADQRYFGNALAFPGRIEREDWVGQARILSKGGVTEFAKRSGKGSDGGNDGGAERSSGIAAPGETVAKRGAKAVGAAPIADSPTVQPTASSARSAGSKKPSGLLKAARDDRPDSLSAIGGVGNALEKKMNALGFFHFDQIARLTKAEQAWLGRAVGFPGRPERENWTGEARRLASDATSAATTAPKRGQIKSKK